MELVYLWVEEYKNIKNQGFNFSPRFECEFFPKYNKGGKLKDNCELKITPKNYVNIFPENINVTAIVGENGSGKSNITRLVLRLLNLLMEDKFNKIKCFLILEINNSKVIIQNNIKINYNTENFINFKNFTCQEYDLNKKLFSLLLDFTLSRFSLKNQEDDKYKTDYALEPSKITYAKTHHDKINTEAVTGNIKNFGFLGYLYLSNNLPKNIPLVSEVQLKRRTGGTRAKDFRELSSKNEFKFVIDKFITNSDFTNLDVLDEKIKKSKPIKINTLNEIKNNLYLVFPLYDFELTFDTNGKFDSLSSGQTFLLCYVGYIIKYIEYCKNNNKTSCTIIIDECETSLHPNWQKESVKFFIDAIKSEIEDNFEINLIFTSHSPFILSDIPKENVIFLDKFDDKTEKEYPKLDTKGLKNGNCINVSKHIELKTFGANIHTLLSNGFFMSNGLMGEFAKSKIGEIKKFYELIQKLQNKGKIKKEIWKKSYLRRKTRFGNIQKIIGEPFLQTIIKNYLDELEILFNGKNQFLDNEIKRLQSLKDD